MLHPVKVSSVTDTRQYSSIHIGKAATSFDCDGCGHHASFHSLENKEEAAILQKWSEVSNNEQSQAITGAGRKRRRIAERPVSEIEVLELLDDDPVPATMAASTRRRAAKPSRKNAQSSASQVAESVLK